MVLGNVYTFSSRVPVEGRITHKNVKLIAVSTYRFASQMFNLNSLTAGLDMDLASITTVWEDDKYYIIKAVGGEDIDANDDFVVDSEPTLNKGAVYAIAKGKELKYVGFKINILTTVSFSLVKPLIEQNATAKKIDNKLADVSSRLLRYKLYPDKTQNAISNTDLLVWLPTTDKDVLLRSYEPLKEMVSHIYNNQDIYKEAMMS